MTIPRTIHLLWFGDRPMPAEYVAFREGWAANNPGWEIRTWDEASLPPLRNRAAYDAATTWAGKADIARLEILERHGGVYVDCDFESLRPIGPLLDGVGFFAARDWGGWIANTLVGSAAGHPMIRELVEAIPARFTANPDGPPNELTGPHLLTELVGAREAADPTIRIFGKETFYPYPYEERHLHHVGEDHPGAVAVHHWAASWIPRRVVVAGDPMGWDGCAGVIGTFCRLFGPDDAIELVLATPAEADEALGARVGAMLAPHLGDGTGGTPEIWLQSYVEVGEQNFDIAVVAGGDAAHTALEAARAVEWMTMLRIELDGGAQRLPAPRITFGGELRERLATA
jgi:hypothetical protein